MKIKRMWVHAVLALVMAFTATAVQGAQVDRAQVRELMALSGLRDQMLATGPWVGQAVAELRANTELPPRHREIAAQVIEGAFETQALLARVEDILARHWNQAQADQVFAFLRSPVGRAVTQMEVAAGDIATREDEQRWRAQLADNPPDRQRVGLIVTLDEASKTSAATVEIVTILSSTSALAVAAAGPSAPSPGPEQVRRVRAAVREQIAEPVRKMVLVDMLYTYREASAQQLREYIDFLDSPTGRWYQALMIKAELQAIADSAQSARDRIAHQVAL